MVLRDLLSSVAPHQWVESHRQLFLHYPSSSTSTPTQASSSRLGYGRVGGRSRRIRSWIVHDKDKDNLKGREDGGGDSSSHFTDASERSDDELVLVDGEEAADTSGIPRNRDRSDDDPADRGQHRNQHRNRNPTCSNFQNQNPNPNPTRADVTTTMHGDNFAEETVDMLTGLMGDGFDRDVVRRVLRKYDGNVDKAAGALLEGERGEEMVVMGPSLPGPLLQQTQAQGGAHQSQSQGWGPSSGSTWSLAGSAGVAGTGTGTGATPMLTQANGLALSSQTPHAVSSALGGRPNTPIDLTQDDDPELQRAMQESMNTLHAHASGGSYAPSYSAGYQTLSGAYAPSQRDGQISNAMIQSQQQTAGPVFGPSERQPDSNWAMVPSQQNENSEANYLQNLNRAIEASLETMGDTDALEPFPVEQQLRRDGCPVVLRPSMHTMVYATTILQGLFYVPQVRMRMACWRPIPTNEDEVAPPMSGPDFTMWVLSEIFTHMDLARLCDLNVDKRLPAFNIEPWDRPTHPPGELSRKFFARLAVTLEKAFIDQLARAGQPLPKPRLLHFQYGSGISEPGELLQETSIVPIDVNDRESNDLIGRLSAQLSKAHPEQGKQSVIFEPSEVVAFELVRSSSPNTNTGGSGFDRKAFAYPKSIYLDQFLRENAELAQAKRAQRQEMWDEVQRLVLHKNTLTHFDGKDTLKDLRASIFYFENVADAKDDLERADMIQSTTRKLKGILNTIEEGIKATDEKINTLRSQAETLLDCEELRRFKYDLRVVFVHDGLYGRKHLYSYVHDKSSWWKIADSLIEQVPEEIVLNDQAGLHLGAGPYLLFYSRATENENLGQPLPWMDDIKDDVRESNREFLSQLPPELVKDIVIDEDISVPFVGNGGTEERMDVSS